MTKNRGILVSMVTSVFLGMSCLTVYADEPTVSPRGGSAPADALRRTLLEKRWDYSKENKAAAAQEFAALRATDGRTPSDDLLIALVQFRQHEHAEAIASLDAALATTPDDRSLLKTRIWMAFKRNDVDAAWPTLARYQRRVLAESKAPSRSPEEFAADLAFLGQIHGYLAGPHADQANERLTTELRDAVARDLSLDDLRAFEEAERGVDERQVALMAERDRLIAEAEEALKAETEAKRAELAERKEKLEKEKSRIDPERDRVSERSQDVLVELTKAEGLAATSVETAARQGAALRREYEGALDRLDFLREQFEARSEGDDRLPDFRLMQAVRDVRAQIIGLEDQMAALERAHAGLNFQFEQIRQRRMVEETALQRNLAKLQIDAVKLEKELEKLDENDAELGDRGAPKTRDIRSIEREAKEIDSYADFSLETVRRKLLVGLASP